LQLLFLIKFKKLKNLYYNVKESKFIHVSIHISTNCKVTRNLEYKILVLGRVEHHKTVGLKMQPILSLSVMMIVVIVTTAVHGVITIEIVIVIMIAIVTEIDTHEGRMNTILEDRKNDIPEGTNTVKG